MIRLLPAGLRRIQLGKSFPNFPTIPAILRATPQGHAESSWERFSQLPPQQHAATPSGAQKPVGKSIIDVAFPNLNFFMLASDLQLISSCGGETTPYGGGERLRLRLALSPLPGGPGGFARPPPI
jgi:hypothetical protein